MLKIRCLMIVLLTVLSAVSVSAIPTACPATIPLAVWSGAVGSVTEGLSSRLRAEPALDGEILKTLPAGSLFTVQADPVCADDLRWWHVKADDLTGWMAEGSATGDYYIQLTDAEPPTIDNSAMIDRWGMGRPADIAWSPNGKTMALATTSGVWLYAGNDFSAAPRLLTERAQSVVSVAFDPANPNMLYAANGDGSLSRWDVAFGSVSRIGSFDVGIRSINFSTTGKILAVLLTSGEVDLLPSANFADLVKISAENSLGGRYATITLSHDETMIALGTDAGSVEVFDLQGQRLMSFALPEQGVAIVSFSPDDSLLAAGSRSGRIIRIWDVRQQTVVAEKNTGDQSFDNLFFLSSGQLLTVQSVHIDSIVVVYSGSTFDQEEAFFGLGYLPQPDGSTLTFYNFHKYNNRIVSIMNVNPDRFFDGPAVLTRFMATSDFVLSADGSRLIYAVADGFEVVDTQKDTIITHIPQRPSWATHYTVSADGRYFAACINADQLSWQPTIEVYDLANIDAEGTPMNSVFISTDIDPTTSYTLSCSMLAFASTPDGERLVTDFSGGATPKALAFWDFTHGKTFTVKPISDALAGFTTEALLRGTTFVMHDYTSGTDTEYTLAVYDANQLDANRPTLTVDWIRGNRQYGNLKATPVTDTILAVTAGYDGRDLALYDLTSLTQIVYIHTPSAIDALAANADGTWIATAHGDGIIRLWNVQQPDTPVIVGKVSTLLTRLMFSPDSQRLYSNGSIWDVSRLMGDQ
jgi:WD40 repeat protein